MNRKQRRAAAREAKRNGSDDMAEKIGLFSSMPDHCLACHKSFDKTDEKQVHSWSVVVREDKKIVRLYCPECWGKAKSMIERMNDESQG